VRGADTCRPAVSRPPWPIFVRS